MDSGNNLVPPTSRQPDPVPTSTHPIAAVGTIASSVEDEHILIGILGGGILLSVFSGREHDSGVNIYLRDGMFVAIMQSWAQMAGIAHLETVQPLRNFT